MKSTDVPCSPRHAAQAAKASGSLTLERMLDMKEAGVDVDGLVSEELRLQMYTKEVGGP